MGMLNFEPCFAVLCLGALAGVVSGQTNHAPPIKTTVCELANEPFRFNRKIVTVSGLVHIAFEDFELATTECKGPNSTGVWLEYGKGPKRQPTTWCCGDMTPRDPLQLVENRDFREFHRLLTAKSKDKACHEPDCYLYKVTATITGRVDAVPTTPCPNGQAACCAEAAFGHFGMFCSRLVIQSVSDVVANPADVPRSLEKHSR